jgi:hypothetical protein
MHFSATVPTQRWATMPMEFVADGVLTGKIDRNIRVHYSWPPGFSSWPNITCTLI